MVLDAGAVFAIARGNGDARAALHRARYEGFSVVIPTPVVAQVHRGGRDRARIDRVLNAVDAVVPTSEPVARLAGELQASAGSSDAIDAIVAAEAIVSAPAVIITSDAEDMRRLLEGSPHGARVLVIRV